MAVQSCFVCSQDINGDEAYFQHHVNSCLDAQSKSNASFRSESAPRFTPNHTNQSNASSSKGKQAIGPFSSSSSLFRTDHALTLALDSETAFALAATESSQFAEQQASRSYDYIEIDDSDNDDFGPAPSCPSCGESWEELGMDQGGEERDGHVENCLLARGVVSGGKGKFGKELGKEEYVREVERENGGKSRGWGMGTGKDQVVGTKGLLRVLAQCLSRSHKEGKTRVAYLCSPKVEHVAGQFRDFGWGCGYRNAQMLFSSLRHIPCYTSLPFSSSSNTTISPIPTIPELQALLEAAWEKGHDPAGAAHFKGRVAETKKWIGTTEIYTVLTWMGIRVKMVDFPKVKGSNGTHDALVKWIVKYFTTPSPTSPTTSKKRSSPDAEEQTNALQTLMNTKGTPVQITSRQPLYLQHQGHSRTVVGVDIGKGGEWLLLFDPAHKVSKPLLEASSLPPPAPSASAPPAPKRLKSDSPPTLPTTSALPSSSKTSAFFAQTPSHQQIWHGKSDAKGPRSGGFFGGGGGGKGGGGGGLNLDGYVKLLEPYRVSLSSLKRKEEYQILYVEEGPVLTTAEKAMRRVITSVAIKS